MGKKDDNRNPRKVVPDFLREYDRPFTINQVAKKMGVSWATARGFLLELAVEGKISAEKTAKSWIFYPPEGED